MFFTKKDRAKLEAVHKMLELLLYAPQTDEPYFDYPLKDRIREAKKLSNAIDEKIDETKVSGSMDLSSVAEDEEDEVRESIAAKFAKQEGGAFFEEESLSARELEVME